MEKTCGGCGFDYETNYDPKENKCNYCLDDSPSFWKKKAFEYLSQIQILEMKLKKYEQ